MKKILILILSVILIGCGTPNIEQSCTMNGRGEGNCSFSNTGDGSGAECGHIEVVNTLKSEAMDNIVAIVGKPESPVFCSGKLEPSSTAKIDFFVPHLDKVCPWGLNGMYGVGGCEFQFVTKNQQKQSITETMVFTVKNLLHQE